MLRVESLLEAGEEIIYQTRPSRHLMRLIRLMVESVCFVLFSLLVPVSLALITRRFAVFPVLWGLPDSLSVLIISVGVWLLPLLALAAVSVDTARIFTCELAVTDRRILGIVPSFWIFKQIEFTFDEISQVILKGNKILFALKKGDVISVRGFQNAGVLTEVCRMRMIIAATLTPIPAVGEDPTRRLKRLKEALSSGLITESEYALKKDQILKQM
ncbi:MAG: SHOCT domain-containing protein [Anaerolineae bacterium]|nr:SHOCT domain-containing protein [Anaerolineae bacterium]